jgi:methane monooxygenase PmoA-like
MKKILLAILLTHLVFSLSDLYSQSFDIQSDYNSGQLKVLKEGLNVPVVTQNAKKGMRPYLHPIRTPDGKGVLTEIHPSHHLHQTGIYWGLKKVNGRDFFMNNSEDYYQFKSLKIIKKTGDTVQWETVYNLINEQGTGILRETQIWSLREADGIFLLDLEWQGEGLMDVKIEKFYVGGLFMRMPWVEGIEGELVNAMGEKNSAEAEGHRSVWVDVGMKIAGIEDWGHIAVLDHPDNVAFPTPWRVDTQLGVGPSRQILGDWELKEGETTIEKYRLVIYTGKLDKEKMAGLWKNYVCESQN